jgi:Tfp pilus assembly protein PilF
MNRPRLSLAVAALVALTVATYWPSLRNGFIWDDDDHFTENHAMTAPDGLRQIWSRLDVSRYYPLTLTTFWVQRRLWGLNPVGYHAVNIALHAASVVVLFALLRRLDVRAAWAGAALWAVHPVNVESVAWATELKNAQSGLLVFASLLCWLRFEAAGRRRWYVGALVCGVAAMLSKPSAVVLPAVLLLCAWWQRRRVARADVARTLPLFGAALAVSALAIVEQHLAVVAEVRDWSLTPLQRIAVAGRALWFYIGKLLWPFDLAFVYPQWQVEPASFVSLAALGGFVLAGIMLWTQRERSWGRSTTFAGAYFVFALMPVLGFFNVYYFRYSFVADHFQYLASVGPLAACAAGVATVARGHTMPRVAPAALIAGLAVLSWQRCAVFHDNERLWRETVAVSPRAFLAHNNLGLMDVAAGRLTEGEQRLREALRIKPDYVEAHNNLGLVLAASGRLAEALTHFIEAVRLKPRYAVAHNNVAQALVRLGREQEAWPHYQEAVRLEPSFTAAHDNLARLWLALGQTNAAIAQYQSGLTVTPDWEDGRHRLAELANTAESPR